MNPHTLLMKRPSTWWRKKEAVKTRLTRARTDFPQVSELDHGIPVASKTAVKCLFSAQYFYCHFGKRSRKFPSPSIPNTGAEEPCWQHPVLSLPSVQAPYCSPEDRCNAPWSFLGVVKHQKMSRVWKSFCFSAFSEQLPSPGYSFWVLESLKKKESPDI